MPSRGGRGAHATRPRSRIPANWRFTVCSCARCNLVRILQSALREALRVRLFVRQVRGLEAVDAIAAVSTLRVPRTSLATLGLRCEWQARAGKAVTHVFVPEKFRESHRRVAERLVQGYFPDAWLGTLQTLVNELVASTP